MNKILRKIILVMICLLPVLAVAQDASPKENKAPATTRAQRQAAKKKWKEQRRAEMEQKKAVKEHHKRIQTKETRKRMKEERKKGDKLRTNKREFFLVRWFKYRRKSGGRTHSR